MKAFAFALLLFTLMLSFITYNYIYVRSASAELVGFTEALTVNDGEAISRLISLWEEKHPFISISTEESKEAIIDDLLSALNLYSELGKTEEFEHTKTLLANAFRGLSAFETFSVHDIF